MGTLSSSWHHPPPPNVVQGGDSLLPAYFSPVRLLAFLVQCVGVSGSKELSYGFWALGSQISVFLITDFLFFF